MADDKKRHEDRARALVAAIQSAECEAHALGLHRTGHALNAAKNCAGWDLTEVLSESLPPVRSGKHTIKATTYAKRLRASYESAREGKA